MSGGWGGDVRLEEAIFSVFDAEFVGVHQTGFGMVGFEREECRVKENEFCFV